MQNEVLNSGRECVPPFQCSPATPEVSYEQSPSPSPAAETGTNCQLECQDQQQPARPESHHSHTKQTYKKQTMSKTY